MITHKVGNELTHLLTKGLTCKGTIRTASSHNEVVQDMVGIDSFPAATFSHEQKGLVLSGIQHVPIDYLSLGVDVGRHVFLLAALQHLNNLM